MIARKIGLKKKEVFVTIKEKQDGGDDYGVTKAETKQIGKLRL